MVNALSWTLVIKGALFDAERAIAGGQLDDVGVDAEFDGAAVA